MQQGRVVEVSKGAGPRVAGENHSTHAAWVWLSVLRGEEGLGHASIATTARYLDHVNPQAVVDMMRSRSWARSAGQPDNRTAG